MSVVDREELVAYLNSELGIAQVRDYCPNGLQVEGRAPIRRIVSGVTASLDLLEAARDAWADAVLVHHGYFWRGENPCVTGSRQRRLKLLLTENINLLAYHLPLDRHPVSGNNAQFARHLGLTLRDHFVENNLGCLGDAPPGITTVGELAQRVAQIFGRAPTAIGDQNAPLGTIAWCTGAAQGYLQDAIDAGASVYLSGEISEPTVHLARESGVAYLACGHHASERYGVQALGEHLTERFGIEHRFIDIDNPV